MAQIIGSYGPAGTTSAARTPATTDINSPQIQEAVRAYIEATRDTGFTITPNETQGYFNLRFHQNMGGAIACKGEDIIGKLTSLPKYYTDHPEQRLTDRKTTTIRTGTQESPAQRTPAATTDRPVISITNDDIPANRRTSTQRTQSQTSQAAKSAPVELSDAEIDSLLPELTATLESKGLQGWTISREGLTFRATKEFGGEQTTVEETAPSALRAEIEKAVTDSVMSLRRAMEMKENDWREANRPRIAPQETTAETAPDIHELANNAADKFMKRFGVSFIALRPMEKMPKLAAALEEGLIMPEEINALAITGDISSNDLFSAPKSIKQCIQ